MYFDRRWQSDLGVSILVANIHRGSGHPGLWPWRERGEKNVLLPLSRFDTYPRWPPVTQSLRSRRSYGKIADCDQSNSISQKKQRYIYSLPFSTTYQCMSFHLLCTLLYMRMRTIPRYCYRPHWPHSCESWWSTRRYLHEKVESHKA